MKSVELAVFEHAQHAVTSCLLFIGLPMLSAFASSAAVLATANLVRFGIEVPQVLVPEHPAIIDGVAVGAVVVAVGRISSAISMLVIFSLNNRTKIQH